VADRICAVVVSLPERHELLGEALESVRSQTREPDDVVIGIDPYRLGEVANMNRLIAATDCEWLAFLHDDDLWMTDHLERCEALFDEADVVVSRFDLVGRPWNTIEPWHDNFDDLRFTNWIGSPSMVVARRETFPGFQQPTPRHRWVDWQTWNSCLDAGLRFADTGVRTTQYRFHEAYPNGSWRG
jgi:glycosyltransferase involved in cell wall biosynthesis